MTLGSSHWDELVRMEGQIRKQRQETIYKQAQRRRKFLEVVGVTLAVALLAAVLIGFIWLVIAAKNGNL